MLFAAIKHRLTLLNSHALGGDRVARFEFTGLEEYDKALAKLGDHYGPLCEKMLARAVKIVANAMKKANSVFARHVKPKKAKHNKNGWYAQVQFGGRIKNRSETGSGTSAARAAVIYEYGRRAGTYTDSKGHTRPFEAQSARPWIKSTVAGCEEEVVAAMQEEYDEAVKRLWTQ